jgi:hypothetical protein
MNTIERIRGVLVLAAGVSSVALLNGRANADAASGMRSTRATSTQRRDVVRLSLQGPSMLDPSGSPVVLRGFNWGNWGLAQPQDASDHVAQGANAVRIILRWWGKYSSPSVDSRSDGEAGHINPENLATLDQDIQWATSQGLWVDLAVDSNCGQNGLQDPDTKVYCDPQNQYGAAGHNFWTDPAMRSEFFEVWRFVAHRYRHTPYIAMYEPLPEPNPAGVAQADVTEFYKEAIRVIKQSDDQTPFLIGPTNGYNIRNAESAYIPDAEFANQLVYTGNLFVFTGQDEATNIANLNIRLQGLLRVRDDHDVPIFVQQTGVRTGDDPTYVYLNAALSLLNTNFVPWTEWDYRDGSNSPNSFGVYYQDVHGNWILKPNTLSTVISYLLH